MTVDHSIDYSFAGKGAKRRKRLQPADTPDRRTKPRAYWQKPEIENRKVKDVEKGEAHYSAMGVKARIRLLVIDRDVGFLELMDILKQQGMPLSGVAAGNLRSEMREIIKLLEQQGLLNVDALARRRRKIKAREAV